MFEVLNYECGMVYFLWIVDLILVMVGKMGMSQVFLIIVVEWVVGVCL